MNNLRKHRVFKNSNFRETNPTRAVMLPNIEARKSDFLSIVKQSIRSSLQAVEMHWSRFAIQKSTESLTSLKKEEKEIEMIFIPVFRVRTDPPGWENRNQLLFKCSRRPCTMSNVVRFHSFLRHFRRQSFAFDFAEFRASRFPTSVFARVFVFGPMWKNPKRNWRKLS